MTNLEYSILAAYGACILVLMWNLIKSKKPNGAKKA